MALETGPRIRANIDLSSRTLGTLGAFGNKLKYFPGTLPAALAQACARQNITVAVDNLRLYVLGGQGTIVQHSRRIAPMLYSAGVSKLVLGADSGPGDIQKTLLALATKNPLSAQRYLAGIAAIGIQISDRDMHLLPGDGILLHPDMSTENLINIVNSYPASSHALTAFKRLYEAGLSAKDSAQLSPLAVAKVTVALTPKSAPADQYAGSDYEYAAKIIGSFAVKSHILREMIGIDAGLAGGVLTLTVTEPELAALVLNFGVPKSIPQMRTWEEIGTDQIYAPLFDWVTSPAQYSPADFELAAGLLINYDAPFKVRIVDSLSQANPALATGMRPLILSGKT